MYLNIRIFLSNRNVSSLLLIILSTLCISCSHQHFAASKDGLKIAYSEYGQGDDLLVFVHGWSCDRSYWDNQIAFFERYYKVITIDLGGHGESGTNRSDWSISSLGDDLVSVIDLFKYKNLYLVGHSMGSMVILDAASKIDAQQIHLFLVDLLNSKYWPMPEEVFESFIEPFRQDFKAQTEKFVRGMVLESTDEDLVDWIALDMSQAPPEIAIPLMKDLWLRDFDPALADLNKKGVRMTIINSDMEETAADELTEIGFQITYIPGTGHFIMMEAPDKFNQHLKALIDNNP